MKRNKELIDIGLLSGEIEQMIIPSATLAAMLPAGWSAVTKTPPDELLKVVDKNGRKGFAYPCWDGGWMVSVPNGKLEEIVGWRRY